MGNLTYLAVTILKRDKRTILNAIMMLFCFCGINLIMLLYKICGLAKEFSNAPYIERLMEVFSLLVIIMFIATIIVLLLVMLGSIKDSSSFYRLQKYIGYTNKQLIYLNCCHLLITSLLSYIVSLICSKLIVANFLRETISKRIVDFTYIDSTLFTETFLLTFGLLIASVLLLIIPNAWVIRKI